MIISQREAREYIETIERHGQGLTEFEETFIESVQNQEHLSNKQLELIWRIHQEKT